MQYRGHIHWAFHWAFAILFYPEYWIYWSLWVNTTVVFLHTPKKTHVTFVGYSWNNQGTFRNIPIFSIRGTLCRNMLRNFIGNFFWIFREYIMGLFHEYSTNIHLPGVNKQETCLVRDCSLNTLGEGKAKWQTWHNFRFTLT